MQTTSNQQSNTQAGALSALQAYSIEVTQISLLTDDQERDLVERARSGDGSARDALIEACQRYILSKAWHLVNYYVASAGARLEVMDVVMEGNLALLLYMDTALASVNPCGFLRKAALGVMLNYCKEHRVLIRTPRTPGLVPHQIVSLDAPIGEDGSATLADLIAS
jgi:hypothetical protein